MTDHYINAEKCSACLVNEARQCQAINPEGEWNPYIKAQFLARRFAKETGKGIFVTASTRMTRCLGVCIRYRYNDEIPRRFKGRIIYEIRLNLKGIAEYGQQAEDIILHELAHTKANGHGKRFRKVCAHMGIDQRHWGKKVRE